MIDECGSVTVVSTNKRKGLVARPHTENRQGALIGIDGHSEQLLIEPDGAPLVGYEGCEMVVVSDWQQPGGRRDSGALEGLSPSGPVRPLYELS